MPDEPLPGARFVACIQETSRCAMEFWEKAEAAEAGGRLAEAHAHYRRAASESIAVEAYRVAHAEATRLADLLLPKNRIDPRRE